jgi:dihydrofolate synthase/folylpolyglutamate synthase
MASGKPVVVAKQPIEAMAVIERMAIERQSELHVVEVTEETPVPGLSGRHQIENAALAIESMKLLNLLPTPDILKATLSQVSWPGRFERISGPELVLDGAHNEHAARVLVQTWKEYYSEKKAAFVFAASADKDIKAMIPVVREIVGEWHLVPVSSPRIMPPQEMAELLAGMGVEGITIHDSLQAGLTAALESSLSTLVAGSLFLVGDVKALLQNVDKRTTSQ